MSEPTRAEVEQFRRCVEEQLGILFEGRRRELLHDVLSRRCEAFGIEPASYVAQLAAAPGFDEPALAAELTVGETYFFRNHEQFAALVDIARAAAAPLAVVSAGCASGEEPYSIAIALRDAGRADGATIRAFDINPDALRRAVRARYAAWSLRETPPAVRERWFVPVGKHVELAGEIRAAVQLERANLLDPGVWPPDSLDVVFCRNVLMYFGRDTVVEVVRAIARALRPGGYLFLGHAETLRGISDDFELCQSHGTFYYLRRRDLASVHDGRTRLPLASVGLDWADTIRDASERVSMLAAAERPRPARTDEVERGDVLELWRQERFDEVLAAIEQRRLAEDPELRVVYAAACAQRGQLEDAERACEVLIATGTSAAAGHFVLGLCCESVGDLGGALEHHRVAIELDAGFALAHLRRGVLARRRNDRVLASRELAEAAALLAHEDERWIVLFGGGFTRQALITLCESELANMEHTS